MSEYITINTNSGQFGQKQERQKYNPQWNIVDNLLYFQETVEKEVRGWFFPYDHALVYMLMRDLQQNVEGDICEIGVAFGRSAIALSNYRKEGEKLYLYDHFDDEDRAIAQSNIKQFGTERDIELTVVDTMTLTPESIKIDKPLRLFHLDGCHEHDAVYKDLTNFSTKMCDDGVIVVDDYNDPEYPGINSGTLLFLSENKDWVMFAIGQNKAYLCKEHKLEHYMMGVLVFMDLYTRFGLQYKPNLRGLNGRNVLLCCSREEKSFQTIKENIKTPVQLG